LYSQALDVPLFQKGYGNDAAQIASDGIAHATVRKEKTAKALHKGKANCTA
jgi:hypothetical protein